jgi:energy-coupling factor transporter ATP-binding protein EcfA2
MKPVIDIYLGSPIEIPSEKQFLARLVTDLRSRNESAFIFANFHTGKNTLQVDFFVVTSKCACHIELKNYTAPVVGGVDGTWKLLTPNGDLEVDRNKNPYHQALNCKYAISDAMHEMARRDSNLSPKVKGRKFYSLIESVVCIFPVLVPGSCVLTDNKVRAKSYDDLLNFLLTHERHPGWNQDQWRQFAMYFGLEKAESFEPDPSDTQSVQESSLKQYQINFIDFHSTALHELVPTRIASGSDTLNSEEFLDTLRSGSHVLLIGPPGSGKSHLVRHASIRLAGERLPILLRARDFDGDLARLASRGIAHAYPFAASKFLEAAVTTNTPVTLIIDGFNECPFDLKQTLVKAMQAFVQKFQFPILITSQDNDSLPTALCGVSLRMTDLSSEERLAIFNSYLTQDLNLTNLEDLLKPFSTPYELSLAAECASTLDQRLTRTTLFDAFARRRLALTQSPAVSFRMLAEIAHMMGERLVNSLAISDFGSIAETVADEQRVSIAIIDQVLGCGLIDSSQGRCAFRHELLGIFFEANALIRYCSASGDLALQVARPRNRRLAEFVTAALSDLKLKRECLHSVADPSLLSLALRGSLGDQAKLIVAEDAKTLMDSARADVVNARPFALTHPYMVIEGLLPRTKYEDALLMAIGIVLHDGMLLDEVVELFEAVESHCWHLAEQSASPNSNEALGYRNGLFQELYVVDPSPSTRRFPISLIFNSFRQSRGFTKASLVRNRLIERFKDIHNQPFGLLYLFGESVRYSRDEKVHEILPAFFETCWKSKFYHLRIQALDVINSFAHDLRGSAIRMELENLIEPLDSNHLFLNNSLIETKVAYGMMELGTSPEDVLNSFREILRSPDDPALRERAYHELACIFEDVFEGAYGVAYSGLSRDEQSRIMLMAALGARPDAFLMDWILRELLDSDDPQALPAFQRWTSGLVTETSSVQDSVACYLLGVMGCAKHLDSPPRLKAIKSNVDLAWQTYAEILFWVFKAGLSDEEIRRNCKRPWDSLMNQLTPEAVDPLMQMENADWKLKNDDRHPLGELCARFPSEVKTILEYGLDHQSLPTAFGDRGGFAFGKSHTAFAVSRLADVGDTRSAALLERLIDSEEYGKLSVETIRRIRMRD